MSDAGTLRESGYAPVNGLRMYYEVHGEQDGAQRPLLLLHGGVLTIDLSFGGVLPALAATRQVIAVELQGHGRTADIDRATTLEYFAEDVVGLLDHLGIDVADMWGFSLGGLTALQTVIRYPQRVGRLVLASVHYRADGYHDEIQDPALQAGSTRLPTPADFQEMQEAYVRVAPDPGHFEEFTAKLQGVFQAWKGWEEDDLRAIRSPTLLMVGDHDFVRLEHAVEMHNLIAGSRIAVLPGTTHNGLMRRTDLVLPMAREFFAATE
ncbi:alpha/beta fold hydrolase [Actinomadura napierensis]|uniref:Alpha/beta hydrolase n=1 Tax=Actinomadura napierensis TaxID=267854 RepID=A0ABP5L2N9_9ACTN